MLKSFFVFIALISTTFVVNAQEALPQENEQTETTVQVTTDFTNTDIEEQLISADIAMIETLKTEEFDFNQKDNNGNPPLYYLLSRNPDLRALYRMRGCDSRKPSERCHCHEILSGGNSQ